MLLTIISVLSLNIGLCSDIYIQISFKLGMMIEITKLYILIWVGWPWPSLNVTVAWAIKNFGVYFVTNVGIDFHEIQYATVTCWLVEGCLKNNNKTIYIS